MIGRHVELSTVLSRLKGARSRQAGTVFMRGEAGIGKSRLLAEALDQARLLGYSVLAGRADELEQAVPYAALREAIEPALLAERDVALFDAVDAVQRALTLRPAASDAGGEPSDRMSLQLLYAEGERLLRAWSERSPVVLALDDLHAADKDTITVVSLLSRHLTDARVVVVSTMRTHAPDRNLELETLVDRLQDSGRAVVLDLVPLDLDDVRALVGSHLGAPAVDEVVHHIWNLSRGNPFFAEESLRSLQEAGAVREIDGVWHLSAAANAVTASRRSTVLNRVFRLGRPVRAVARVVSAMQAVSLDRTDLVAELAGVSSANVARALDELVRANVLRETAQSALEFVHPIVRSTLYEDLGPAECRRMHGQIAAYLLARRAGGLEVPVTEIALHVAEAAEPGDIRAGELLAEAGEASAHSAPLSAAAWFARALDLLPAGHPSIPRLLARRARALFLAGRFDAAAAAGTEALSLLGPGRLAARTAALVVSALTSAHRFTEALDLADRILEGSSEPMARLRTQRASLLQYLNRFDEAREEGRRALALAGDDAAARAAALGQLGALTFAEGDMPGSLELLDAQLEIVDQIGPVSHLSALVQRSLYLALFGMVDRADAALVEARKRSVELGEAAFRSTLEVAGVITDWLGGRWDGALERWHVVKGSDSESYVEGLARCAVVAILARRGRHADAAREAVGLDGEAMFTTSMAAWARAALAAATGQASKALDLLRATVTYDIDVGRRSALPLLLSLQLELELETGDVEGAHETGGMLETLRAEIRSPWANILALRSTARLKHRPALAVRALALAEEHDLRVEAAQCRALLAHLGVDPAENLSAAHDAFDGLGAEQNRRRVAAELRRLGLRVPRRPGRTSGRLTDTERELARLVHEGRTNKEIAAVLYLSPKTIEVYLTRLFAKAGLANRLDLALAFADGRLDGLAADT